jgi:hypothetical protein
MLLRREPAGGATVVERVIERLGGLQAQQAAPPFAGLWTRIEGFKREDLLMLLRERRVVRATTLRGTLHLITSADFREWRPALQPMLTAGMESTLRDRLKTVERERVLETARALFKKRARTFTSLRDELMAAFPEGDERAMGYFVRTHLPLASVLPELHGAWGFPADAEFELAPVADGGDADGGQSMVLRYLAAFGPATVADFQAWSALKGAKPLFDSLKDRLVMLQDHRKRVLFDLPDAPRPAEDTPAPVRFIAEFDNLILGHADRSRVVADEHRPRVVTKNLLVLGTFLVDGFVAGIWRGERKKKEATLKLEPFEKLAPKVRKALEQEGERFAHFLEPEAASVAVTIAG